MKYKNKGYSRLLVGNLYSFGLEEFEGQLTKENQENAKYKEGG